jgi:hypothetical protein
MTNVNTEGLPPEMQQRIAEIIEKAKANAVQPYTIREFPYAPAAPTQPAPVAAQGLENPGALAQRPPSLMDHIIALRQEVAQLRNEVHATAQVTEAVGNAVGSLYQMFHQQTEITDQSSTYASQFQQQPVTDDDF